MEEFFNKIGIKFRDENGNIRHTSRILDELLKKWGLLTEEEQNFVREKLGNFEW